MVRERRKLMQMFSFSPAAAGGAGGSQQTGDDGWLGDGEIKLV